VSFLDSVFTVCFHTIGQYRSVQVCFHSAKRVRVCQSDRGEATDLTARSRITKWKLSTYISHLYIRTVFPFVLRVRQLLAGRTNFTLNPHTFRLAHRNIPANANFRFIRLYTQL